MAAQEYNLVIEQGASWRRRIMWRARNADGTPGDPIDLTDATIRMQIRKSQQAAVLLDASTENGKIRVGEPGEIILDFTDEDTDRLSEVKAKYDLEVVLPSGDMAGTYRLLQGTVAVSPNITQTVDDPKVVGAPR